MQVPVATAAKDQRDTDNCQHHDHRLAQPVAAPPGLIVQLARPVLPGHHLEIACDQHRERSQQPPGQHHAAPVPGHRQPYLVGAGGVYGGQQPVHQTRPFIP